jgi:tetratricopeptide (TPR) repeat protein
MVSISFFPYLDWKFKYKYQIYLTKPEYSMKAKISCLFLCIALFASLSAQERSFGPLPLVNSPRASLMDGGSMEGSPEEKKAKAVYEKLVAARGDFRFPVPTFKMTNEERRAAGMDYDLLEIVLEKKAYDVCAASKDPEAAIAFLLGHELTHYYEKHAWRSGFATDYKDLDIGIKLDGLIDDTANETEADYLGGFLAYSAGYGLFDNGPKVIGDLYEAYKLKDDMPGYPSLKDRKTMSTRTAEKLQRLVDMFDMANLLAMIGKYPEAYEFYRYVLMEYQSREIYNNLGVTAVLDAMEYFTDKELKFRYPVQLDLESSASEKGDGAAEDKKTTRERLLRTAILHFDAAISMDPQYATAYLNKACAYAMLGDPLRARFYAENEALPIDTKNRKPDSDNKTALDVKNLLGILEATAGNTAAAQQIFKSAADAGSALAGINLKLLNGEDITTEEDDAPGFPKKEYIDDQTIGEIANAQRFDAPKTIKLNKSLTFYQKTKQGPNSKTFICQNNRNDKLCYFHLTGPDYSGETGKRGVKIALNSDRKDIIKAYDEPARTVETPRGQILVYTKTIFILDEDNKLMRWVNYLAD